MMITPPSPTEITTAAALLAVIANPEHSAKALAEIRAAVDEYRAAAVQPAAEKDAALVALSQAQALQAENRKAQSALAEESERQKAYARMLAERDRALAEDYRRLEDGQAAHEARVSSETASLQERERAVALRETACAEAQRIADALIAEYNEKLAKFRALAG